MGGLLSPFQKGITFLPALLHQMLLSQQEHNTIGCKASGKCLEGAHNNDNNNNNNDDDNDDDNNNNDDNNENK